MKALKKESSFYMEQIASAITACYESNDKSSNQSLMELYTLIGRYICRQGEKPLSLTWPKASPSGSHC